VIVVKFGGTSVGDAAAIERAASIVQGRLDRRPVVVVSALGGATNALLAVGEQSAKGHLIGALRNVETLRDRHLKECEELLGGTPAADEVASDLRPGVFLPSQRRLRPTQREDRPNLDRGTGCGGRATGDAGQNGEGAEGNNTRSHKTNSSQVLSAL
jgi:aspartokinase